MSNMPDDAAELTDHMNNPCRDTVWGWLWYCKGHDTHGNAGSEDEARFVARAHEAFARDPDDEASACELSVTKIEPRALGTIT
jgi:hypothetical protein